MTNHETDVCLSLISVAISTISVLMSTFAMRAARKAHEEASRLAKAPPQEGK